MPNADNRFASDPSEVPASSADASGAPYPPSEESAVPYPKTVQVAGAVWIIYGIVALVNLAFLILFIVGAGEEKPDADREAQKAAIALATCFGMFQALIGLVFIHVGIQSIRGTARDTLGNGIGSLLFGLINLAQGGRLGMAGDFVLAGFYFLFGVLLIGAGVLALAGRREYRQWREASQVYQAWQEEQRQAPHGSS